MWALKLSIIYSIGGLIFGQNNNEFTLSILHLNDFHARFEQTSVFSGRCTEDNAIANKCFGGFPRIHSKVEELRATKPNTIFMAGGDYYQGTVWYTIHKWRAMAHFLNLLKQDVMSLGNHEFDDGIDGLVPFLDNVTFPCLAANIDDSAEPTIRGKILPSVTFVRGGRRIGVIGYVTTETAMIANPGKVVLLDEVTAVRKEASLLKSQGIDIIIALGHAGFRKDLEIAMNVPDVDIVVGGHTNTFLYSGNDPSTEPSVGEYPTVITQDSGRRVLVVQAYAFGKYLGHLDATFDNNGEIIRWEGNPIILDNTVTQDPVILEELKPWKAQVQSIIAETIGRTFVFLDGNRLTCRMRECNLGNLITDAIIHQNAKYPDNMHWARTALAVLNGGGIRASIDERADNGSISMEDILTVAPFQNTIDIVELRGIHVRQMFEHSVGVYDPEGLDPSGRFLQTSGFHVTYDISKPAGSRVASLKARCIKCRVPEMEEIQDNQIYAIAMPAFLANGGDSFTVVRDKKVKHHLTGLLDTDIISQYIRLTSPVYQGTENRILFLHDGTNCKALPTAPLPTNSTIPVSPTSAPPTTPLPTTTSSSPSFAPPTRAPQLPVNPFTPPTGPTTTRDSVRFNVWRPIRPPFKPFPNQNIAPFNPRPNQRVPHIPLSHQHSIPFSSVEYDDLLDFIYDDDSLLDGFLVQQSSSTPNRHILLNPFKMTPHQVMKETMHRHEQLFLKEQQKKIKQTPDVNIRRRPIQKKVSKPFFRVIPDLSLESSIENEDRVFKSQHFVNPSHTPSRKIVKKKKVRRDPFRSFEVSSEDRRDFEDNSSEIRRDFEDNSSEIRRDFVSQKKQTPNRSFHTGSDWHFDLPLFEFGKKIV